ncbi:hypothetical protein M8J77_022290 [Diaphorina citri]|nr:hypothetical protein M8J77_022290 [Diaphorina citri]
MRMISGSIRPTPTHWLPVLSHIPPPNLRRQEALLREFRKIVENQNLPIHEVLADARLGRLISRHAPVETANNLVSSDFDILRQWHIAWDEAAVAQAQHLPCIETQPPGFELTRRLWVTLNRIRTKFGKCAANLHKWGLKSSAACDCGAEKQKLAFQRTNIIRLG